MKAFTIPYNANGKRYDLTLEAESHDDALRRLRAAYLQANPPEQLVARIPVPSWAAKMIGGK